MEDSEITFNLVYVLFCICVIYPPEVEQRPLEKIFSRFLGLEHVNFVRYHQKRTLLNLLVHTSLPTIYFVIHDWKFSEATPTNDDYFQNISSSPTLLMIIWGLIKRFSFLAFLVVPALGYNWSQQNWRRHPISQTLMKFSNIPDSYEAVASDIATECRRPDVYRKKLNPISTVIATENWIIKTTLYNVYFAHQSDSSLIVAKTDTYSISSQDDVDSLQMVSIQVKSERAQVPAFDLRINARDFRDLEERVNRPIVIPESVRFHRSTLDRFVDVFKEQVELNAVYITDGALEKCFACMIAEPNVKINKQCLDVDVAGAPLPANQCCVNCYCRPMWCVDCLARWFATRQNDSDREIWLQQKCSCPMCRAKFCVLDVSYIRKPNLTGDDLEVNGAGD